MKHFGRALGVLFWLGLLGWGAWWGHSRYERGEWPWVPGNARGLAGISLLSRARWTAARIAGATEKMLPPKRITIHHSGGKVVADLDQESTGRLIKSIQEDHQKHRHWSDIGYHYIIDRSGRIWEGRSVALVGAHAGSVWENQANLGVLVLGNFDLQSPAPAELESLERLVEALRQRHGIPRSQVYGHGEVRREGGLGPTNCPGKSLAAWVEKKFRQVGGN
jgi:hypothetical protein